MFLKVNMKKIFLKIIAFYKHLELKSYRDKEEKSRKYSFVSLVQLVIIHNNYE